MKKEKRKKMNIAKWKISKNVDEKVLFCSVQVNNLSINKAPKFFTVPHQISTAVECVDKIYKEQQNN